MNHISNNVASSTTSTPAVRKCSVCREPGHNKRTCPTMSAPVAPCAACATLYELGRKCGTCVPRTYGFATAPTPTYVVGCSLTMYEYGVLVVREATPEEFGDALLHVRDMWDDDSDVVVGMGKTYKMPEVANPAMGSMSAYTTEVCPTCKRVYSGADIVAHLHTHSHNERMGAHMITLYEKADTLAYVSREATRIQSSYTSESEGLTDTGELSDAHVREAGKQLSVEVVVSPTRKCKAAQCMQKCEDNPLVTKKWTMEGSTYKCVHGTQWNEVWDTAYTHARWDHLRDAHLQEQTYNDDIGQSGINPYYRYMWRQKHTRVERVRSLLTWVDTVGYKTILRTLRSDVLKERRNLTVSAAVGFTSTPMGKWEGVEYHPQKGFIRTYTHNGVQVTRFPDWSALYLTKDDLEYITLRMKQRVGWADKAPQVAKEPTLPTLPTSRHRYSHPLTKGDTLLQRRLITHTIRQDAQKWDTSAKMPQVSKGVAVYVETDTAAQLSTLWGTRVHTPTYSTF